MTEQEHHFKGRALFKGHDMRFGIFYPTNYLIAIFDSPEIAERAEKIMLSAGYADGEVDSPSPEYVVADYEKAQKEGSLIRRIEQRLTRHFGSDSNMLEEQIEWARKGAGFLAVYCPTEHEAERVLRLLKPLDPRMMRRYERLVIEDLV